MDYNKLKKEGGIDSILLPRFTGIFALDEKQISGLGGIT